MKAPTGSVKEWRNKNLLYEGRENNGSWWRSITELHAALITRLWKVCSALLACVCQRKRERGEKKRERESGTVGAMFMQTSACESRWADIYNSTYARPHTESSVCMCACVCVLHSQCNANRPFNAEMWKRDLKTGFLPSRRSRLFLFWNGTSHPHVRGPQGNWFKSVKSVSVM